MNMSDRIRKWDAEKDSIEEWLSSMLLNDEIRLKDIPQTFRCGCESVYITAFRFSRSVTCKRYIQDLTVLCQDIYSMDANDSYTETLVDRLNMALSNHSFGDKSEFIDFKENIYPEVKDLLKKYRKYGTITPCILEYLNKRNIKI